jgi:hypothetical protein
MLFKPADNLLAPHFAGFLVALFMTLLIYIGSVCWWVSAGCPDLLPWGSRFWVTRFVIPKRWWKAPERHHIWGPSGPVKPNADKGDLDEEEQV